MAGAVHTIDIAVAWAEIERRQARLETREQFRYIDRVPVVPGIYPRFWLYHLGYTWAEYASSPRRRLEICVEANKWVLEHVRGSSEDVYHAAARALEILAPCRGFLLQEGANMPPEAKPENIESMVRAAEDFGPPPPGNGGEARTDPRRFSFARTEIG